MTPELTLWTGFNTASVISLYLTHVGLQIWNWETFNLQPKMPAEVQGEAQLEEAITLEEALEEVLVEAQVEALVVVELAAPQPWLT